MSAAATRPRIVGIQPLWAVAGGRITIAGTDLMSDASVPDVRLGAHSARVVRASSREVTVVVPVEAEGGHMPVRLEGALGETAFVEIGERIATGLH